MSRDMIDIQKWGYVSVAESGLCCSYINGAMFMSLKGLSKMGLCLSPINGAMLLCSTSISLQVM